LLYSTYLGGSGNDTSEGISVDASGNSYITGSSESTDFPVFSAVYGSYKGYGDAFVAKISPGGNSLIYSTYLGGSYVDKGWAIATDGNGNAYIAGGTGSADFPTVSPIYGTYAGGYHDVFVAKIDASGSSVVYSTYLGGGNDETGSGIAVDASGNAYITGFTRSNPSSAVIC
jgi:hypothetical protein